MQVLGVIPTCTPNCATDLILRSRVAFVLAEEAGGVELSVGVAGGGRGPEAVVDAPRVSRDAISIVDLGDDAAADDDARDDARDDTRDDARDDARDEREAEYGGLFGDKATWATPTTILPLYHIVRLTQQAAAELAE
jgi:hypothetical protein